MQFFSAVEKNVETFNIETFYKIAYSSRNNENVSATAENNDNYT